MDNKRIRFPLNLKVGGLVTVLLIASLSLYVFFALDLYKKDKSAYIYETGLTSTQFISQRVKKELSSVAGLLQTVHQSLAAGENARETLELLSRDRSLIVLNSYSLSDGKRKFHVGNKDLIFQFGLEPDFLDLHFKDKVIEAGEKMQRGFSLNEYVLQDKKFLQVQVISHKKDFLISGLFPMDPISSLISRDGQYQVALVGTDKETKDLFIGSGGNGFPRELARTAEKSFLSKSVSEGVENIDHQGQTFITSFSRLDGMGLLVLSTIPLEKAYQVATFLMQKSLSFGGIVIGISPVSTFNHFSYVE